MTATRELVAAQVTTLATWAASVSSADVPEDVQRRAIMVLADDMAAMVASHKEPEVASARETLLAGSHRREAAVLDGAGSRADRWTAAVANGIACNWAELDEGYRLATCHAGLYAVPAAVAEAEAEKHSLGQLLTAIVISYEITTRFARAWTFRPTMLHPHGVFAPLGAAAAIAKLRGFRQRHFLAAISGSATLSLASPFNHAIKGIAVRNAWAGAGSWLGMHAVDWAAAGMGGSAASAFDVYSGAFSGQLAEGILAEDLGTAWAISSGYHKLFACCQYGHSAVEASLALRIRLEPAHDLEAVQRIDVETHPLGMALDNRAPDTTLAGKFSMQHIVATTLINGSADHRAFTSTMLEREDVVRLRDRVVLAPFHDELTPPRDRPARVTITLRDGRILSEECWSAQGGPDRPLTEDMVLDKITSLTVDIYPRFAPAIRRLLRAPRSYVDHGWDKLVRSMLRAGPVATRAAGTVSDP